MTLLSMNPTLHSNQSVKALLSTHRTPKMKLCSFDAFGTKATFFIGLPSDHLRAHVLERRIVSQHSLRPYTVLEIE